MTGERIRPRALGIETSTYCQLRCPSCPNTHGEVPANLGRGLLDPADFEALLVQNPFVREVELSNYGEPFRNPRLVEILRIAERLWVRVRLDTGANLNTADEEQLEALVRYRVRSLSCSIDGATPATYRRYRVGGSLETVLAHLRTIERHKRAYGSPFPVLTWQFIVFGHNEHELGAARRLAAELGMRFRPKLSWDPELSPVRDAGLVRRELGYATRTEYRAVHGLDPAHTICTLLWEQPQLNWDGRVLGCPCNFWGEFGGNAFTDGLLAAVNSERLRAARRMLAGHGPVRHDVPCADCSIYHDRVATGRFVRRDLAARSARWLAVRVKTSGVPPVHRRGLV